MHSGQDLYGRDFPIPGREEALFIMGADPSPDLARLLPTLDAAAYKIKSTYLGRA